MPIGNGLGGLIVDINPHKLFKRGAHGSALPANFHLNLTKPVTGVIIKHAEHSNFFVLVQRGNGSLLDAPGLKWKLEFIFQIATPAYAPLMLVVAVDHDFHFYTIFTL
jgi:hypothetical protein